MSKVILDKLEDIPRKVEFKNIQEFDRMEERFFDIQAHFGDILGMSVDSVEFCPNHKPPEIQSEILPWLWLIHPELKVEILQQADDKLKKIIAEYDFDSPAFNDSVKTILNDFSNCVNVKYIDIQPADIEEVKENLHRPSELEELLGMIYERRIENFKVDDQNKACIHDILNKLLQIKR